MRSFRYLVLSASALVAVPAMAAPVVSGDVFGPAYTVDAKARWANTGQEGQLLTPDGNSDLNPSGAPVWQSGQNYNFSLAYTVATGTSVWSIDFNDNGSFGAGEVLTDAVASLAGKGFTYVNLLLTGSTAGSIASVADFTINGTNFGSFSNATGVNTNNLYEDSSGLFGNLLVTGALTFNTAAGGTAQERPRLYVSLGAPATPGAIPEPATWALLIVGFGMAGAAIRARKPARATA